ncbi:MAG: Na(+)-translocating NADH-quinone reductase subunit C [Pseudobacteriovorax sp.]|nr:Na(+)-translocating NADH-quinone reductase subunit C [Pseudobacteriovorax sp.]
MSGSRETVGKTITVAAVLCIACSILVSAAAVSLRSTQQKNKALDKKKNILAAAGLLEEGADVEAVFAEKVKIKIVNLGKGTYNEDFDPATFDQRKAAKDPDTSIKIPSGEDLARIKRRATVASVYEVYDNGQLKQVVFPVHGKGLWSTMYGFLALEPDMRTVAGLGFYEHGETPGLGGEIDNPKWKATWVGKKIFDDSDKMSIDVLKGQTVAGSPKIQYEVDGLSGATLTANGVEDLVRYWLAEDTFKPYIEKIRQRGA